MDKEKEEFLKEFSDSYGYPNSPKSIDAIRATEFKRLDGLVYLDHAGATLYSELQMDSIFKELTSSVYGNPHTQSDTSMATSEIVRKVREQVLDFCNASPKDYTCIFTSGATSALKLVGEAFPWSSKSCFMYSMENHNSVLGIREYALDQGGAACAVDIEESVHGEESSFNVSLHNMQRRYDHMDVRITGDTTYNLFAMPSECNFSGVRFNLELVKIIQENSERVLPHFHKSKWMVLIDAAKGCATEKLDLSRYPADFVTLSFYKLFGYPTGLGALIVRNDSARVLRKRYFSGGTVSATIADIDFVKRRESIHELFEDGTASFLSIASLLHGFKVLNTLTIPAISRHTTCLAAYLRKVLLDLKHDNGASVCLIYGNQASKDIGPVISFNLRRPDGSWFGYREVEKLGSLSGIQLRTGCFCNPGACAKYLGLTHHDLLSNVEAGHVCWDDNDILHGKPTGAVRVSFGYMSTFEDAKKFISFVKKSFVHNHFTSSGPGRLPSVQSFHVKSIYVYPIKSCAGFSVQSWPLSSTGFLHDRAWVLKSVTGEILNQKKVPEMGLISTSIDLDRGILIVKTSKCKEKLEISVKPDPQHRSREEINLHARRYEVQVYDDNDVVSTWFSNAIGRPCNLLRCSSTSDYVCPKKNGSVDNSCRDTMSRLNFTNEAQFLLVSEQSLSDLNTRINSETGAQEAHAQISPTRFRPNIVISGGYPYAEDHWITLRIGRNSFSSLGGCSRCQMINLSSEGGKVQKSKEPLATLASYRRVKGKILFGILLRHEDTESMIGCDDDRRIKVGDEVLPDEQLITPTQLM